MSKLNSKKLPPYDKILGVKISSTSMSEVLKFVEFTLKKKVQLFISTPNPEIVLQAQSDKKLAKAIEKSDIAIPDGVGLLWASKKLGFGYRLERIPGRILLEQLFHLANRKKYKIFLLGATKKTNESAILKLKRQYPSIVAKGNADLVVSKDGKASDQKIIKEIKMFKPHLLFVAFGAPKQEKWVSRNLEKLDTGVVMVVGGALDSYAGTIRPVPKLLSDKGLEWLWRLVIQPSRLPRVFNAVVNFPLLVLKTSLRG